MFGELKAEMLRMSRFYFEAGVEACESGNDWYLGWHSAARSAGLL